MKRTLLSIWLAGGLLRFGSFLLSENAGGDALARVSLTAQWLQHPCLQVHFGVWLPLHFWLIGAASLLVGDVELAGRVVSLIFGVLSVGVVAWLTDELAGEQAALFSTIVFSFYSLHIAYSATSSSDVPYMFLALTGLALFFRWRNVQSNWLLLYAGIALTCAAGFRYEAWILIFGLILILVYRRTWWGLAIFAPASGAFPLFWAAYEWHARGNPLYAPALNHSLVTEQLHGQTASLLYRLALPAVVVAVTLTPIAVVGALRSLRLLQRNGSSLAAEFLALFLFFASVEMLQITTGGVMSFARYTLSLGSMIAVLSGIGLQRSALRPRALTAIMCANLLLLSALSLIQTRFEDKARSVSPVLHFRRYLDDAGGFLKAHLKEGEAVVLDSYNDESNELAWRAGFPLIPNSREFIVSDSGDRKAQASMIASLVPFIQAQHPAYVVFSPQGELSSFISLPAGCTKIQLADSDFECVFDNSEYQIYKAAPTYGRRR
ncbi:MAG TPA: glycosyltransferase family 39 protein [Terracidiphilus sp.]|nr:glycosyltransferase family 39 protein [Terracidiphilus sp.]